MGSYKAGGSKSKGVVSKKMCVYAGGKNIPPSGKLVSGREKIAVRGQLNKIAVSLAMGMWTFALMQGRC
jgi:hypothetical protein